MVYVTQQVAHTLRIYLPSVLISCTKNLFVINNQCFITEFCLPFTNRPTQPLEVSLFRHNSKRTNTIHSKNIELYPIKCTKLHILTMEPQDVFVCSMEQPVI